VLFGVIVASGVLLTTAGVILFLAFNARIRPPVADAPPPPVAASTPAPSPAAPAPNPPPPADPKPNVAGDWIGDWDAENATLDVLGVSIFSMTLRPDGTAHLRAKHGTEFEALDATWQVVSNSLLRLATGEGVARQSEERSLTPDGPDRMKLALPAGGWCVFQRRR
jgi:hypothetical protein